MELIGSIIIPLLAFILGGVLDRIHVNQQNDSGLRDSAVQSIDDLVTAFHGRFGDDQINSRSAGSLFDYEVRSLVDDTSIRSVIGGLVFDGEYTRLIGEIYMLSVEDPAQVGDARRDALLSQVNQAAIDLKKIIKSNASRWRLFARH